MADNLIHYYGFHSQRIHDKHEEYIMDEANYLRAEQGYRMY